MNCVAVVGDPEKVCSFIASLIAGSFFVYNIKKTKNNATYLVTYSSIAPFINYLLMEDGSFLLLEDGAKIILD
jgi:hypothetical protein